MVDIKEEHVEAQEQLGRGSKRVRMENTTGRLAQQSAQQHTDQSPTDDSELTAAFKDIKTLAVKTRTKTASFTNDLSLVDRDTEASLSAADAHGTQIQDETKEVEEIFLMALQDVIALRGLHWCKEQLDIVSKSNSTHPKPVETLSSLSLACRTHLSTGSQVRIWTEEALVQLVKDAAERIEWLEGKIKETEVPRPGNIGRIAYHEFSNTQGEIFSSPVRAVKTCSRPQHVSTSDGAPRTTSTATVNIQTVPISKPTVGIVGKRTQTDVVKKLKDARVPVEEVENARVELQLEITKLENRVRVLQSHSNWMMLRLLKNFEFGCQLDDEKSLEDMALQLRDAFNHVGPHADEASTHIEYLEPTHAFLLADDFNDIQYRPMRPHSIRYIEVLLYEYSMCQNKPDLREEFDQHMLWLGTRISDVALMRADEDIANLVLLIYDMLRSPCLGVLGVAGLFAIVTNICQRAPRIGQDLWKRIFDAISAGAFGGIFVDWNILSRIMLCWLLSHGPPFDLAKLGITKDQSAAMGQLVILLRGKHPRDFPSLFKLKATKDYLNREKQMGHHCEVLSVYANMDSIVVFNLPTSTPAHSTLRLVWTTDKGICTLSQQGIRCRIVVDRQFEGLTLCLEIQAAGTTNASLWFRVTDKRDCSWLMLHYEIEYSLAVGVFKEQRPGS